MLRVFYNIAVDNITGEIVVAAYRVINGAQNYMVGDDGTVWSKLKSLVCVDKMIDGIHNDIIGDYNTVWCRLKPRLVGRGKRKKNFGRQSVLIYMYDGTRRKHYVHQIVAEYFFGPKPPDTLVLHKNDDKWDNN